MGTETDPTLEQFLRDCTTMNEETKQNLLRVLPALDEETKQRLRASTVKRIKAEQLSQESTHFPLPRVRLMRFLLVVSPLIVASIVGFILVAIFASHPTNKPLLWWGIVAIWAPCWGLALIWKPLGNFIFRRIGVTRLTGVEHTLSDRCSPQAASAEHAKSF
jgi:hypothetical protein